MECFVVSGLPPAGKKRVLLFHFETFDGFFLEFVER